MGFASKCSIFELPESGVEISKLKCSTCDSFPLIVSQFVRQHHKKHCDIFWGDVGKTENISPIEK